MHDPNDTVPWCTPDKYGESVDFDDYSLPSDFSAPHPFPTPLIRKSQLPPNNQSTFSKIPSATSSIYEEPTDIQAFHASHSATLRHVGNMAYARAGNGQYCDVTKPCYNDFTTLATMTSQQGTSGGVLPDFVQVELPSDYDDWAHGSSTGDVDDVRMTYRLYRGDAAVDTPVLLTTCDTSDQASHYDSLMIIFKLVAIMSPLLTVLPCLFFFLYSGDLVFGLILLLFWGGPILTTIFSDAANVERSYYIAIFGFFFWGLLGLFCYGAHRLGLLTIAFILDGFQSMSLYAELFQFGSFCSL